MSSACCRRCCGRPDALKQAQSTDTRKSHTKVKRIKINAETQHIQFNAFVYRDGQSEDTKQRNLNACVARCGAEQVAGADKMLADCRGWQINRKPGSFTSHMGNKRIAVRSRPQLLQFVGSVPERRHREYHDRSLASPHTSFDPVYRAPKRQHTHRFVHANR